MSSAQGAALAASSPWTVSINPATGEEIGRYRLLTPVEIEARVSEAYGAYQAWRTTDIAARAAALRQVGSTLRLRATALANGISLEMGKPITAARAEVGKCASLCDWYADNLGKLLADEPADVGSDGQAVIRYLPLGPVLAVMPWNFPLWQVLRAAVPIIAAGNVFLLKHADNVQGCAASLAEVFQAAGVPSGVFSVLNVTRHDLPDLIADKRIVAVTVTAGVAAGAAVAAEAGRHLKKSVLELGGSDPFIVLADADLDRAVAAAVQGRFQNTGQVCIAAKRLIIERSIAEAFTARFVEAAKQLKQGSPLDEDTQLGPLARERSRVELHELVEASLAQGAQLMLGGVVPEGPGAFYPATVLTGVTNKMSVAREETFGPVAAILVVEDADEAVKVANDSDFGLSGAIWSGDAKRAAQLARRLETGGVFINGVAASDPRVPIGGVKQSGFGRELSHFGLREFCNAQLCWIRV